jgi:hypothetical protein
MTTSFNSSALSRLAPQLVGNSHDSSEPALKCSPLSFVSGKRVFSSSGLPFDFKSSCGVKESNSAPVSSKLENLMQTLRAEQCEAGTAPLRSSEPSLLASLTPLNSTSSSEESRARVLTVLGRASELIKSADADSFCVAPLRDSNTSTRRSKSHFVRRRGGVSNLCHTITFEEDEDEDGTEQEMEEPYTFEEEEEEDEMEEPKSTRSRSRRPSSIRSQQQQPCILSAGQ